MEKEKSRKERLASKENVPVECTRQSGSSFSKQYPILKGREERRSRNIPDDQCAFATVHTLMTSMKSREK